MSQVTNRVVTVVHCLAQDGSCDWRYDKYEKDWQCMSCGIWEKTAARVPVPRITKPRKKRASK